MKILVIGGSGYVGYNFIEHVTPKVKVACLDKKPSDSEHAVKYLTTAKNTDVLAKAMMGCNAVYHLAWTFDSKNSFRKPYHMTSDNVLSLTNVLCTAVKLGIDKVVYSSTAAVYGNMISACETDPTIPINHYGAQKLAGEAICKGFYAPAIVTGKLPYQYLI